MRVVPRLLALLLLAGAARLLAAPLPPHPRLILTDAGLQAAFAAAKTDPLRAQLHATILATAERDLAARDIVYKLEGPRLLTQSRLAIQQILTLAMAYRLSGDDRFLQRAVHDMSSVAAFADWHPAHFLDVAEMSFAMGIGYDWLYNALTPAQRATFEKAIVEKSLVFIPLAYRPQGKRDKDLFFVTAHMNWNQVCNGGLLTAALAVGEDHPDMVEQVVAGLRQSLPLAMEAYQPDGAYPEGPGYWEYGTTYNVILIAELESALGTDFGLAKAPAFDKTTLYRLAAVSPSGDSFNYADGDEHLGNSATLSWLANRFGYGAVQAANRRILERDLLGNKPHFEEARFFALRAAWFPAPATAPAEALPLALHFQGNADIAILRSSWTDPKAIFLGFKAGNNAANHSHLDLGSFVLDSDGVRWAEDLGPDDYNLPEYFGKKRWNYFRLTNFSHNTITPGTMLQDPKAVAPITGFGAGPARAFAVANLSPAYPDAADAMTRGVALLDGNRVLVQDEIVRPRAGMVFHWNLITHAAVLLEPTGKLITLTQGEKTLTLRVVEPLDSHWTVKLAKPPTREEKANTGDRIISLEVTAPEDAAALRIAVVAEPTSADWPKRAPLPELEPLASWK